MEAGGALTIFPTVGQRRELATLLGTVKGSACHLLDIVNDVCCGYLVRNPFPSPSPCFPPSVSISCSLCVLASGAWVGALTMFPTVGQRRELATVLGPVKGSACHLLDIVNDVCVVCPSCALPYLFFSPSPCFPILCFHFFLCKRSGIWSLGGGAHDVPHCGERCELATLLGTVKGSACHLLDIVNDVCVVCPSCVPPLPLSLSPLLLKLCP